MKYRSLSISIDIDMYIFVFMFVFIYRNLSIYKSISALIFIFVYCDFSFFFIVLSGVYFCMGMRYCLFSSCLQFLLLKLFSASNCINLPMLFLNLYFFLFEI